MGIPPVRSVGTGSETAPTLGTHAAGDLVVFAVEWATGSMAAPGGGETWTSIAEIAGNASNLYLYGFIATGASHSAGTVNGTSNNHAWATHIVFEGPWTSIDDAIEDIIHTAQIGSNPNWTIPGFTTTMDDSLVAIFGAWNVSSAGPLMSGETNASLSSLTEEYDAGTVTGNGGGLGILTGGKAAAGAVDTTSWTASSSTGGEFCVFVLKPPRVVALSGTVLVNGSPAADGGTITLIDEDDQNERIEITLASGDGTFSTSVRYDDHDFRAIYDDGAGVLGMVVALAGTGSHDITITAATQDPPTPIYGTYPANAAAVAALAGESTVWDQGWRLNGAGDPQAADFGGEDFVEGTEAPTYDTDGFLAGDDRAVTFEDASDQQLVSEVVNTLSASNDLVLAAILRVRSTADEHDIIRQGDGGLSAGTGWSLTFDETNALRLQLRDDEDADEVNLSLDITAVVGRWFALFVVLDRATDTVKMAVAYDPGTGLTTAVAGTDTNAEDLDTLADAVSLTLGKAIDAGAPVSAGFEISWLALGVGSGSAGSAAADPEAVAEAIYMGIIGSGEASGDLIMTATPALTSADTSPSFSFTSSAGAAEYSIDGAPYAAATSPIVLADLADGTHTLIIRVASDPTILQSLTWTVVSGDPEEAPGVPIPGPFTSADPEYIDHVAEALGRLCQYSKP